MNVNSPTFYDGPVWDAWRGRANMIRPNFPLTCLIVLWQAKVCRQSKTVTLAPVDRGLIGNAKPHGGLGHEVNTGCRSKVERLMTFSTSLVAVWYSSDS